MDCARSRWIVQLFSEIGARGARAGATEYASRRTLFSNFSSAGLTLRPATPLTPCRNHRTTRNHACLLCRKRSMTGSVLTRCRINRRTGTNREFQCRF